MIKNKNNLSEYDKNIILLKDRLSRMGKSVTVFDFDGTLINSGKLFGDAQFDAAGFLLYGDKWLNGRTDEYKNNAMVLNKKVHESVMKLRVEFGANPVITKVAVGALGKGLGLAKDSREMELALNRIDQLYLRDIPEVFDGAKETVDIFKHVSSRQLLMTHAESDWTWVKYLGADFTGMFEKVVCMPINYPKSVQWAQKYADLQIDPKQVLAFGDDFYADIMPNVALDAHAVWIDRGEIAFSSDKPVEIDDKSKKRIIKVSDIKQAIPKIICFPD
jgi:FMN phosphatase YigB (HAD superfamily)